MEITFISDTHTKHKSYTSRLQKGGDVIVCCGDITSMGEEHDLIKFAAWYDSLPFQYKILIAGNHDFIFEQRPSQAKRILKPTGITYLENEAILIDGVKFYGSPITPYFNNWAFTRHRGMEIKRCWDLVPADTQVLITHGPPLGILDKISRGPHVGCETLLETVQNIKPVIHAFGHVHEAYGTKTKEGTYYINASLVNEKYQPAHQPVTVSL